ncbi:MAG: DNA pilot protein [Microviridae sp.]|nr:MAG: DNA pilot protein [Microviridae sp.]
MVNPMAIVAGIGAVTDAIGKRNDRKTAQNMHNASLAEQRRINQINRDRQDNYIQRTVADGRLAGLSPLASMGNAGFTPAVSQVAGPAHIPTGTSGASLAGDAIQTLLQQQGMNQQILESRSRTLLNEANAAKIANQPDALPPVDRMPDGRRIEHSTIVMKTQGGKEIVMPNNELMEGLTPKEIAMFNAIAAGSRAIEPKSLPYRAWQNFNKYIKKHGGALTGRRRR